MGRICLGHWQQLRLQVAAYWRPHRRPEEAFLLVSEITLAS